MSQQPTQQNKQQGKQDGNVHELPGATPDQLTEIKDMIEASHRTLAQQVSTLKEEVDGMVAVATAPAPRTAPAAKVDKEVVKEATKEAVTEVAVLEKERVITRAKNFSKHFVPLNKKELGMFLEGSAAGYVLGGMTGGAIPFIR